jgi:hypothetical protein
VICGETSAPIPVSKIELSFNQVAIFLFPKLFSGVDLIKMNTGTGKKTKVKVLETSVESQNNFDFDTWAVQVRQQMIAALNRRGAA